MPEPTLPARVGPAGGGGHPACGLRVGGRHPVGAGGLAYGALRVSGGAPRGFWGALWVGGGYPVWGLQ